MKQILQQFTLRASLLVMLLVGAVGSMWGEEVIKTLDLTAKTTNMQSYTGTFNWGEDWSLYGCANNNGQWAYVRFGGKASTSTETKTGASTITAKTAINSPLNEIKISHNGISKSNCTIKSVVLSVASDANYNNIIKTITLNPTLAVATKGTFSFTDNFASNSFYKITINWSVKGTTNCGLDIYTVEFIKETETESVATPTFTPAEGTYTSAQNVTISTTTDGATVYYTTDGTDPSTSSSVYSSPINVSQTTTIKAIAVKGMDNSAVAEATYTINIPETNVNWVETSLADLTTSDVFVIVGNTYAMTNNNGTESAPVAVSVTIADGKITSIVDDNMKWTISGNATDGYTFYPNGSTTTWLYCNTTAGSSSNNNMRVGTGDRKLFKPNNNGYFVTNDTYTARYISIYNNSDWRGYTSTSNGAVALKFYKRVSANEPTLTAPDVELAYDAISGSIAYTLNNATGGTLSATSTADWLTIGTAGETIPFTCDANSTASERTATVILTYSLTSGGTLTATVTVTQAANPNAVSTIAEVRSQGTGSVQTKGVVTSVNGKTAYIQDATAAIAVYNSAAELTVAVGDEIKVSGTLGTYNGLLQIQSPTINVISNGNTVTPEVMTISQVNASNNQGWLVKIEEAKVTEITDKNVTIAQGENTIVVRFNNTEDITVTENDIITLTGNIGCYNTTKQIANPTDIVKKELITVTLTFNDVPSTIVINETATYAATANPAVTGITYQSSDEDVVMVDANTGEIAALALGTATITASYVGDDDYKSATASYTITVVAALHTAKFFVNGEEQTEAEAQVAEGAAITFPEATPSIEGKTFVGWTIAAIDGETDEAPAVLVTTATMGTADVTYYAVYATQEGEGSATTVTDELTRETTGVTGTNYTEWSDKTATSVAVYAGQSAGGNESIQLRSNNNNSGVVTTTSGGKATKVAVVWNSNTTSGRTLNIYGSNSAYTAATDLYDSSKQGTLLGTVVNGTSTELTITGDYAYIGLRSASGAMYLTSISITWENGTPASYSGYCTTVTTPEQPITVTIGSVGYATFVAPADVSFPEGVEAFIVTAISTSSIHMEPKTAVPSGTPVVVRASEGTHELSVATETDDVTDNLLRASDGNVKGNGTIYALGNKSAGVGFYPVKSGANVPEGKAYLVVGNENIKEFFSFDFGGLVTEINNVGTDADANVEIYNLAGQRVQKLQKGFYIVGGKKVLVK